MEKEAMAGEAADVAGNGRMGDPEHAAHLAVPRALGDEGSDGSQELRVAKPVGGREGAMGEGAPAVDASVNLYALRCSGVAIGPTTDETPVGIRVMEVTGWIGAMGGVVSSRAAARVSSALLHIREEIARAVPRLGLVRKGIPRISEPRGWQGIRISGSQRSDPQPRRQVRNSDEESDSADPHTALAHKDH